MTILQMRESELERKCRVYAERQNCLFLKFVSPGMAGVPDRILIRPDGSIAFIELKTFKGKVSKLQNFIHDMLRRWRQEVYVVRSLQELQDAITPVPRGRD